MINKKLCEMTRAEIVSAIEEGGMTEEALLKAVHVERAKRQAGVFPHAGNVDKVEALLVIGYLLENTK